MRRMRTLAAMTVGALLYSALPVMANESTLTGAVTSVAIVPSSGGADVLIAIAGAVEVTDEMSAVSARGDAAAEKVIRRAQAAGALRDDVGPVDVALLIDLADRVKRGEITGGLESEGLGLMAEMGANLMRAFGDDPAAIERSIENAAGRMPPALRAAEAE